MAIGFDQNGYYLGDLNGPMDALGVDGMLKSTAYDTAPKCVACGGTPDIRIMPKHAQVATEDLRKHGYMCRHCLNMSSLSTKDYHFVAIKRP